LRVFVRLSNCGAAGVLMIAISVILMGLLGKIPDRDQQIAIIAAIVLMTAGIFLAIDVYVLGENCPSCAVRLRHGTHACYRCGYNFFMT